MIKKFQIEVLILVILILSIFISYSVDTVFYNFVSNFNNSNHSVYLKEFFIQITILGNSAWYFVLSIGAGIVCYFINKFNFFYAYKKIIKYYKKFSLFLFFSLVTTAVFTYLIKFLVGRPRPNHTSFDGSFEFNFFTTNSDFHSFPSGHTSTIFTFALVASFFLPKLKYFFIFLAGIIGSSRIITSAHFITDVFGGIVIAYVGVKFTKIILDKYYTGDEIKERKLFFENKIYLLLVVLLCLAIFLAVGFSFDIYFSGLFYYGKNQFLLQEYYYITIFFRKIILPFVIVYVYILPIFSFFLPINFIYLNYNFRIKDMLFLWVSGALNLLIIVNLFLKNLWGRARPGEILQLDGKENFSPWYQISDACTINCSFVSGDAAVGFSIIVLYLLIKNKIFLWMSLILGFSLGFIRILEGGHFLSDVILSAIIMFIAYHYQTKYYLNKYA